MSIPDFQTTMLPLLQYTADQKEHSFHEAVDALALTFHLTDEEREELLPSGRQATFDNRLNWASSYLKHAELLESTKRGYFRITQRGMEVLQRNPTKINIDFLMQFPEFQEFRATRKEKGAIAGSAIEITSIQTPEELLEDGYQKIRQELAQELLNRVKACSPRFFERLVVELLVMMGYGGSIKDAGEVIGKSGDEGIDGTIKEDRLGLDVIYIQAKKWEGTVGRPEIQKFVGALYGQRAKKGVFITTSSFTREAEDYARNIDSKVILIDGKRLAEFMIDFNVGVAAVTSYEIKRIDSDYFTEI
jgi:restriction system protein